MKKFRRRRRLGVLVTSNAAIAAARKAALNGIPMTIGTNYKSSSQGGQSQSHSLQRRVLQPSSSSSSTNQSSLQSSSLSLSSASPHLVSMSGLSFASLASHANRALPITTRGTYSTFMCSHSAVRTVHLSVRTMHLYSVRTLFDLLSLLCILYTFIFCLYCTLSLSFPHSPSLSLSLTLSLTLNQSQVSNGWLEVVAN